MKKLKLKKRVKGRKEDIVKMYSRLREYEITKTSAIRMVAQFYEMSESTIRRVINGRDSTPNRIGSDGIIGVGH